MHTTAELILLGSLEAIGLRSPAKQLCDFSKSLNIFASAARPLAGCGIDFLSNRCLSESLNRLFTLKNGKAIVDTPIDPGPVGTQEPSFESGRRFVRV